MDSFRSISRLLSFMLLLGLLVPPTAQAQQDEYILGDDDVWEGEPVEAGSQQALVLRARQALAMGQSDRARAIASAFLDRHPLSPLRPEMLLVRGDALLMMGDEYNALFDYEEIARKYPGSKVFVTALEREYQIAVEYAHGLKRKFLGTIRVINADDEAQELLILIQERLPGSRLGEQAGMQLADFYFRKAKLRLAAEAYDLFIQNYPRSDKIEKARQRLIESYLASYRGPNYDASGLRDARARLENLRVTQPALAQRIGSKALLVRIYESEAQKLLVTARWYRSIKDPVSAEQYIRRLVNRYPDSVATLNALREVPELLKSLPEWVVANGPDYDALSLALLGVGIKDAQGVPARPEVILPVSQPLQPTTPVRTSKEQPAGEGT